MTTLHPPSHFDVLVFDLGKVIIDFNPSRALTRLMGKTPYSIPEIVAKVEKLPSIWEFESGRMSSEEFFVQMKDELQLDLTLEEFTAVWSDIFSDQLILEENFFTRLKPKYRLLLLSNTNPMHASFLKQRFPILRVFDHLILSYEVGAMKPDEIIYQAAQEAARTEPSRIFYVDDVQAYVEAARLRGWEALRFTGRDQLVTEMRKLGIDD